MEKPDQFKRGHQYPGQTSRGQLDKELVDRVKNNRQIVERIYCARHRVSWETVHAWHCMMGRERSRERP